MTEGIRHPFATPPAEGAATEVAPGILWLRLPLPMALDHVNIYALDDGAGWTIVDAGLSSRRSKAIWDQLLAGPLGGKPVNRSRMISESASSSGASARCMGAAKRL